MNRFSGLMVRVPLISSDHKGPVVNLVGWITMTIMCLSVTTVLISKLMVLRKFTWTDPILSASMFFSIGYIISLNSQVSHGLGAPFSTLSTEDYKDFQAAGFAAQLLFVTSIFLAKLSCLTLLIALSGGHRFKKSMLMALAIIVGWAITSFLIVAFQCSLPNPWAYTTGECLSQTAFWTAEGIISILFDIALMGLPIFLVYKLQLPLKKKIAVCFAFSFRVLAIAATIFRMAEVSKLFDRTQDITFESWLPSIAMEIEIFFSIFTACVPRLRPFMDSIQAGYLSGVIENSDGRFDYGNDSYVLGKVAKGSPASATRNEAAGNVPNRDTSLDFPQPGTADVRRKRQKRFSVSSARACKRSEDFETDRHSQQHLDSIESSTTRVENISSRSGIVETKEWIITYEGDEC